jgi:hypothetical protein
MKEPKRYWFPAKRYGWGWGVPNTWQGWAVLAIYFLLLVGGIVVYIPAQRQLAFVVFAQVITAALIGICWLTGEPPRWRWGDDGKSK